MQTQPIRVKQFGNVLQITVEIPWSHVTGKNQWEEYFEEHPVKTTPNYWAITTEKILKLYKKHGNISKTAKASGKSYYITEKIIKEEQTRQNKAKRQAEIENVKKLAESKISIKDIAQIIGKSPETVRLWLKQ
ncbi:helix-turn-helix domain-containing protein [Acidithiobacillus thiooxidans]|uniref:helix-turn-helix domain-containing protein n=1 Tax=Acidithiobacillus thiooxidans TaxID=930 RepID=UPI00285F8ABA|nr:helix-turn-helix domain-containing protein [Acidithiobacillus thiooxidans]MDR7926527.1 helix-turn-helix domain-containing protein [Acidithiobacillus thiooxidans]